MARRQRRDVGQETGWLAAPALSALATAGRADAPPVLRAVSFLAAAQNDDGGWGCVFGSPSDVWCTSEVLLALSAYKGVFILESQIGAASSSYTRARCLPSEKSHPSASGKIGARPKRQKSG